MADPKVRIDPEIKEKMEEEVSNNPEYSSQKAFVNKAVKQLLNNESEQLSEDQKQAVRDLIKEELE